MAGKVKSKRSVKNQKVEDNIYEYINSGAMHSTLVGRIISMDNSDPEAGSAEVRDFARYIVDLVEQAEHHVANNVKSGAK